ncbi:MAG: DUF4476 domain-containing protein [Chitinophaga sp.]|uniref:DUF4476 domain-containing protein n=1 Tax=Chitinophaga sp. TaxID=1869181 RepID=UPI0025C61A46|nr:DUF4476 domain-containing protein [Chitinophaga sp.]MBV8254120.1 DUF4476 domain-containing protein [Chitinophaga sp.]
MFLLLSAFVKVQGQQKQHYYVYIQSEKGQPFYVKHNGDVLSSTERGYIIIPKLGNGTVPIIIGFPGNQAPEQHFDLKVAAKDQGFLLKKASANAYTLYNLQSFGELKSDNLLASAGEEKATAVKEVKEEEQPAAAPDSAKEMLGKMKEDLNNALGNSATITGGQIKKSPAPKNQGNTFASALDKVVVSGDDREDDVEEVKPAPTTKPTSGKKTAAAAASSEVAQGKAGKDRGTLTDDEKTLLASVMADESKTAASEAAAADVAKAANQADGEEAPKKSKHAKKRENNPDFIEFQDDKSNATTAPVAVAPVETPVNTDEQPAPSKKKRKEHNEVRTGEIVTDTSGYGVAIYDEPASSRKKKKRAADADVDVAAASVPAAVPEASVPVEATPRKKKHKNDEEVVAADNATEPTNSNTATSKRLVNSDCGNIMDDGTFRKMLRKFVASSSDEGMLDIFRKQSRNYCMETSQIKTLAQLVVGEDARYRLLDMAYSKTYDTEKYGTLESVLTDNYYKGRFKAMLHK